MSMEAELVQALGRIEAKADVVSKKVQEGGNRMRDGLRNAAKEADSAGAKMSMLTKGFTGLAKGFAAGLGFGSVDMIGSTALGWLRTMRAEAAAAHKEMMDRGGKFLGDTRGADIRDPAATRAAIAAGAPTASDEQRTAILAAIRANGGDVNNPAAVQSVATYASMGPKLGMSMGDMAGLVARAQSFGVSNPADLAARVLNQSGGDVSKAMSTMGAWSPAWGRTQAKGAGGAFNTLAASSNLSPADIADINKGTIAGLKSQSDIEKVRLEQEQENRRELRTLSAGQAVKAVAAGAAEFSDLSPQQLYKLVSEYAAERGIADPMKPGVAARMFIPPTADQVLSGSFRGGAGFPAFLQDRIQTVRIAPGTAPIGDDQP